MSPEGRNRAGRLGREGRMKLTVKIKDPTIGGGWYRVYFLSDQALASSSDLYLREVVEKELPDATDVRITREYHIEREKAG